MPDINDQYYQQHLQLLAKLSRRIKKIYEAAIIDISIAASMVAIKPTKFSLSLYPIIEKKISDSINKLHGEIYSIIVSGIESSWDLSNKKNDLIVDKRLASKKPSKRAKQILYDPNKQALDAFIQRKQLGLTLSDRVWRLTKPFKHEIEQGLGIGISEGRSAKKLASELQKNLQDPDRLFRRVKSDEGKMLLSTAARNYHPGQGIYRSSYKNALRLTKTENNIAYRSADFERWQKSPFVTGIEIKLSKNHPRYDICDNLVGRYPKEFKFVGFHPNCLCFAVPIMMNQEQFSQRQDEILGIGKLDERMISKVKAIPSVAKRWIERNADRINGLKNKPYWVRDNPEYIKI